MRTARTAPISFKEWGLAGGWGRGEFTGDFKRQVKRCCRGARRAAAAGRYAFPGRVWALGLIKRARLIEFCGCRCCTVAEGLAMGSRTSKQPARRRKAAPQPGSCEAIIVDAAFPQTEQGPRRRI